MGQIKKYWVDKATGKYLTKNIDGQDHLLYKWVDGEPEIVYGALYNHFAAIHTDKISSDDDWIVPSYNDYVTLQKYNGGTETTQGKKLKEVGHVYWNSSSGIIATNEYGFNGRGSGYRQAAYTGHKASGQLWTTTTWNISLGYLSANLMNTTDWFPVNTHYAAWNGIGIRLLKTSTTLSHGEEGEYVGNDGTKYQTICIGTQEWLAENLIETKYRNGDTIPIVEDDIDWSNLTTGAMCYYDNDINNAYV